MRQQYVASLEIGRQLFRAKVLKIDAGNDFVSGFPDKRATSLYLW